MEISFEEMLKALDEFEMVAGAADFTVEKVKVYDYAGRPGWAYASNKERMKDLLRPRQSLLSVWARYKARETFETLCEQYTTLSPDNVDVLKLIIEDAKETEAFLTSAFWQEVSKFIKVG